MTKVRERILNAAQACFRRAGIKGTSVQDIAAAAGIARSSFYRQFRDLDEILLTLAVRAGKRDLQKLTETFDNTTDPAEKWSWLAAEMVRMAIQGQESDVLFAEDNSLHVIRLFYHHPAEVLREMIDALSPFIESGKTSGELRTDVETDKITEWLLRQTWALSSIPLSSPWRNDELGRYIATFVLPGLLHPKLQRSAEGAITAQLITEIQRLSQIATRLEIRLGRAR